MEKLLVCKWNHNLCSRRSHGNKLANAISDCQSRSEVKRDRKETLCRTLKSRIQYYVLNCTCAKFKLTAGNRYTVIRILLKMASPRSVKGWMCFGYRKKHERGLDVPSWKENTGH